MSSSTSLAVTFAERVARFHDLLANEHREQALEEIARAQQESPAEQGLCLFLTGLFFLQEGYAGRALQAMEEAFRREPTSRECLYGVAMANSALGFYQEVLFCNKIGATTREIAHERGWGEVLTPSLRARDRLLFLTDEQVVLSLVEKHRRQGNFLKAATVAEDALLVFPQNDAWRRAAIVNYRAANRSFASLTLLQPFAARQALNLENQLLMGEILADLGNFQESLSWLDRVASADKKHAGCSAAVAKLSFCSRPPFSNLLLSTQKRITGGLPHAPRSKGAKMIVQNRLRIGILSSDLLLGGLVERIAPLFEMFDKSNIEFFLYIDSQQQDALTENFMALAKDHFQTHAIDDDTLARIIHEDEIDVLLDLDLRSIYRRPAVARLKPACLQVVAFADPQEAHRWGYDAVLSDPFLSPQENLSSKKQTDRDDNKHKTLDDTTPCPVLSPRWGFLQVADLFDVQPISPPQHTKVRVGLSAAYASFDGVARDLIVRCLLEVPDFELLVDSETMGGEKATAALLASLEKIMPPEEYLEKQNRLRDRLRVLPENASMTDFLQQTDLLLDIAYPRSAYTVWQCLRHAVPVLTLKGKTTPERLGFSVVAQMGMQDMCACEDDDDLLSRLRAFCADEQHRQDVRKELQRRTSLLKDRTTITQKALAVVEALFEGVVTLGRKGRYQPSNERQERQER